MANSVILSWNWSKWDQHLAPIVTLQHCSSPEDIEVQFAPRACMSNIHKPVYWQLITTCREAIDEHSMQNFFAWFKDRRINVQQKRQTLLAVHRIQQVTISTIMLHCGSNRCLVAGFGGAWSCCCRHQLPCMALQLVSTLPPWPPRTITRPFSTSLQGLKKDDSMAGCGCTCVAIICKWPPKQRFVGLPFASHPWWDTNTPSLYKWCFVIKP